MADPLPPDPDFADRPVVADLHSYKTGAVMARHVHRRAQLIFATVGAARLETEEGAWIVPPGRAVLIPGGVHHSAYYTAPSEVHVAYFDGQVLPKLLRQGRAFALSGLLKELVGRIIGLGWDWSPNDHNLRVIGLMVDELSAAMPIRTLLPYGRDPRLRKVTDALLLQPGCNRDLEGWAALAATSPRTLARLFLSETESTFAQWREQLRVSSAIQKMADGQSVTQVAFDLGYASASSFTTMFTRAMGQPPRAFLESLTQR